MSFSSEVKTELAKHLGKSRHCQIAELAALIAFEGIIPAAESENRLLMQKYQLLLAELFHIEEIHTEEEARSVFSTTMPRGRRSRKIRSRDSSFSRAAARGRT